MDASSMERISQWVASQEVPSDLTVRIGDSVFPLHKAVMVPKCGYIRRAVAAVSKDDDPTAATMTETELYLSAIPGGADAFEKVALYCYGANDFEITAGNAVALLCAAAFLDMPPENGLTRRVEEFLAQSGLRTLSNAVAVLRSCERLLPAAEEVGIARRAADAVALRICNEAMFPTTAHAALPGWWTAELAALAPASFGRVATALRCRRAGPEVIGAAAAAYAELTLAEVLLDPAGDRSATVLLLESVVEVLPPASDAPLPAAFLCRLLHAAVNANASANTCRDLELRVAAVLEHATAGDLLGLALDGAGERVTHADTVRRVIAAFVERHVSTTSSAKKSRRASLSGGRADAEVDSSRLLEKVARTVDEAAAEMATEAALAISKFVGILGAVPRDARATHDWVYRAVDIYLKTHPELDEIQREKVCSVMDPLRLSYQARLHAAQNKRLPLQAVLSALYYDNLKIRSSSTAAAVNHHELLQWSSSRQSDASSLARENEALRLELARMRAYLSAAGTTGMQMQHSSSSSKGSASSRAPAKKKASFHFLGSVVSRTLSRLNPFKAKDTSNVADGRHQHVVKPKRRRFSIS